MIAGKKIIPFLLLFMAAIITASVLYYGSGFDFVLYATEHWLVYIIASIIVLTDIYMAIYIYKRLKGNKQEEGKS